MRPSPSNVRRPRLVWAILVWYAFGAVVVLLGFASIYSGSLPMTREQKVYFGNLTVFDHVTTALLGGINITAAILLFRLRRSAVQWFAVGLALSVALTIRAVLTSNWIQAVQQRGVSGYLLGLGLGFAVLAYAIGLRKKGVLA